MSMILDHFKGGYFFVEESTIGTTAEEFKLALDGQVEAERIEQIKFCMQMAMCQLSNVEPAGSC